MTEPHRPRYVYCGYPDTCCGHEEAVAVECRVCGMTWPCETTRSHHTPGQVARMVRWAEGRAGRPPCTCEHHRSKHGWDRCAVDDCSCRAGWYPDRPEDRRPAPPRRPKCSDIDADHVVDLARQSFSHGGVGLGVVAALVAEGWPERLALAKVEKLVSKGRLDYGVSPYYAWPEPDGDTPRSP